MTEEQRWEVEEELNNIDAELDYLYYLDQHSDWVNDRLQHDIRQLQQLRNEIKALLAVSA